MKREKFNLSNSIADIKNILNNSYNYDYEDYFPSLNANNYNYLNGKYVKDTAFFIDLRNSSKLLNGQNKKDPRVVARYYRAYISQVIRVLHSQRTLVELNIVGDCVSGLFAPRHKDDNIEGDYSDVVEALESASMLNPLLQIINVLFQRKYPQDDFDIKAGIGIDRGKTLIIKSGEYNSGESKYIFLGDNVNTAAHLCDNANKNYDHLILVDKDVANNCKKYIANSDGHKTFYDFLDDKYNTDNLGTFYGGDFYRIYINNELEELESK